MAYGPLLSAERAIVVLYRLHALRSGELGDCYRGFDPGPRARGTGQAVRREAGPAVAEVGSNPDLLAYS